MAQVHHATARKLAALIAEFGVAATLEVNPLTGNPELFYDDRKFEAESAKKLVEALRAELEDDEDYTGSHLEDLEIESADDEEDEDEAKAKMNATLAKYKPIYKQFHDTCGDELAATLQAACYGGDVWNEANFLAICAQNDIDSTKWHGNNGQRKMCLSNMLRARLRKGMEIVVLGSALTAAAK